MVILTVLRVGTSETLLTSSILILMVHAHPIAACRLTQYLSYVEHELCLTFIHLLDVIIVKVGVYQSIPMALKVDLQVCALVLGLLLLLV